IDARGDGELPDGVEPGGEEARAPAAEDRRPVIERARGGIGRGQLGETESDGQSEQRHQRPAEGHLQGAAVVQAVAVERDRAGEHGDDGEAEREIREPAHLAQELLRGNNGFNREVLGEIRLKVGQGITGTAVETMRPVTVDDARVTEQFEYFPQLAEERYPAFLAVPLLSGGRPRGALVLQRAQGPFSEADLLLALT